MKLRVLLALLASIGLALVSVCPVQASANVWITLNPPSPLPTPSSYFSTTISASSWNGVAGAIDIVIHYDPSVIHVAHFSVGEDSPFYGNLAIDTESYSTGSTAIAGFQLTDQEAWETPVSLGTITWLVVGESGTATEVTIEARSVVDGNWGPVEVMAYGQRISISPPGQGGASGENTPQLNSIDPDRGSQGQTLDVIITGSNFGDAAGIDFGDKISVDKFNVDNATVIHATLAIDSSAARGPRNVSVTTPRGTDILEGGFVVTRGPLPVWIWVVAGLAGAVVLGVSALLIMRRRSTST